MAGKDNGVYVDSEFLENYCQKMRSAKNGGSPDWEIFRRIYWAIYIFFLGILLLYSARYPFNMVVFLGYSLMLLSVFYGIYGIVATVRLKIINKR